MINLLKIDKLFLNSFIYTFRKMSTTLIKECEDIVWMDMEMTGLNVENDKILEVSCLITNKNLDIKHKAPDLIIHQPLDVLNNMNEWCMKHHTDSGLVDKCKESNITISDAEDILVKFLKENIPENQCPLAGNSIYMDRMFLKRYMPKVDNYLHYRIIDVSTVKELAKRWNVIIAKNVPKKKLEHRSLDDVCESIEELKYYRQCFFNITEEIN